MRTIPICALLAILAGCKQVPSGVTEFPVPAEAPKEISGAVYYNDGFAVAGDSTPGHVFIFARTGAIERAATPLAVNDFEGLDYAEADNGDTLWLYLSENDHRLIDDNGTVYPLPDRYAELCNQRGAEGLALRWDEDGGTWLAAIAWEGGRYRPCTAGRHAQPASPRIGLFRLGDSEPLREFDIHLDVPEGTLPQSFRLPALAFAADGDLIALLASTGPMGGPPYSYSWLLKIDAQTGALVAPPYKLEDEWGRYRAGKNLEALDISPDGEKLLLGYDSRRPSVLIEIDNPF